MFWLLCAGNVPVIPRIPRSTGSQRAIVHYYVPESRADASLNTHNSLARGCYVGSQSLPAAHNIILARESRRARQMRRPIIVYYRERNQTEEVEA